MLTATNRSNIKISREIELKRFEEASVTSLRSLLLVSSHSPQLFVPCHVRRPPAASPGGRVPRRRPPGATCFPSPALLGPPCESGALFFRADFRAFSKGSSGARVVPFAEHISIVHMVQNNDNIMVPAWGPLE